MIKNRIAYLLFVVIAAYFAVMYNRYSSLVALWLVFVVPLVAGIVLIVLKKKVEVKLSLEDSVEEKGKQANVIVKITNASVFPLLYGQLRISYAHELGEKRSIRIPFSVDGKRREKIEIPFACEHYGLVDFSIETVKGFDYFGLFAFKNTVEQTVQLAIVPSLYEEEKEALVEAELSPEEEEESLDVYVDNGMEQKDVREYRPGDSLKRVHWKLSAKKGKWMTKEMEQEQGEREVLFMSMLYQRETPDFSWYEEKIDDFVARAMMKIEQLQKFEVVWYHPREHIFLSAKIDKIEDLCELVEHIVGAGIGERPEEYEIAKEQFLMSGYKNR